MKAPHFWSAGLDPRSREAAPLTRALLTPLEALYIWGVRRKLRTATPAQAAIPVICVGNLTTGGSGKTPIVTEIRERLTAKGLRAASLSRGYGGSDPGPRPVHPETDTARQTGDESLMLSHTGEAWIGRDRPDAARQMTAEGVDVIIMDDGFQNPSLAKDVSILVIDAAAPFGNGFALPKGPLREPVADGLARADAVILMGDGEVPAPVASSGIPVLRARLQPSGTVTPQRVVAFAGIGRPLKFFDTLSAAGFQVCEAISYPDHHPYTQSDLTDLRKWAQVHSAQLITTTKDMMRLPPDARHGILDFPVKAVFEDEETLDAILNRALKPGPQ